VNLAILRGNLGQNPETGKNGVCRFTVATNRRWTDQQGNRQEDVQWHQVVVFNKLGENCARFLKKGSQVLVEGRIEYREYEGKWYTSIIARSVEFLDKPDGAGSRNRQQPPLDGVEAPPEGDGEVEVPF